MKHLFIFLILSLSIKSYSQKLECCNNIQDVQKAIEGQWKLKGHSEILIYKYSFNKEGGFIEVLEELNLPPKAAQHQYESIIGHEGVAINIKLIKGIFFIETKYAFGNVLEPIIELNKNRFIYGKGNTKRVFIKD